MFTVLSFNIMNGQDPGPDSLYRFRGYTVYNTDSALISNVHVLNLSKGTGTVSSSDGSFELYVREGAPTVTHNVTVQPSTWGNFGRTC